MLQAINDKKQRELQVASRLFVPGEPLKLAGFQGEQRNEQVPATFSAF